MVKFNINLWTLRDYMRYSQVTDLEKQSALLVGAIESWDYDVEITLDNYLDLPVSEFKVISDSFATYMQEATANIKADDNIVKKIKIKEWRIRDFNRYSTAVQEQDFEKVLNLVKTIYPSADDNMGVMDFFILLASVSKAVTDSQKN